MSARIFTILDVQILYTSVSENWDSLPRLKKKPAQSSGLIALPTFTYFFDRTTRRAQGARNSLPSHLGRPYYYLGQLSQLSGTWLGLTRWVLDSVDQEALSIEDYSNMPLR